MDGLKARNSGKLKYLASNPVYKEDKNKINRLANKRQLNNLVTPFKDHGKVSNLASERRLLMNYILGSDAVNNHIDSMMSKIHSNQLEISCPPVDNPGLTEEVLLPNGRIQCVRPPHKAKTLQKNLDFRGGGIEDIMDELEDSLNNELKGGANQETKTCPDPLGDPTKTEASVDPDGTVRCVRPVKKGRVVCEGKKHLYVTENGTGICVDQDPEEKSIKFSVKNKIFNSAIPLNGVSEKDYDNYFDLYQAINIDLPNAYKLSNIFKSAKSKTDLVNQLVKDPYYEKYKTLIDRIKGNPISLVVANKALYDYINNVHKNIPSSEKMKLFLDIPHAKISGGTKKKAPKKKTTKKKATEEKPKKKATKKKATKKKPKKKATKKKPSKEELKTFKTLNMI